MFLLPMPDSRFLLLVPDWLYYPRLGFLPVPASAYYLLPASGLPSPGLRFPAPALPLSDFRNLPQSPEPRRPAAL